MIYSTFVMKNDHFIPGALMFAYGLKKQGIKDPIYCFVTKDISETARFYLSVLFDEIIEIDTVKTPYKNDKTRDDRSFLFTRFEILKYAALNKIDKIMIADSDILPLRNYHILKEANSPSAILNEKKDYATPIKNNRYDISQETLTTGKWLWHEMYTDYLEGKNIPKTVTDRVINDPNNLGMNTSILIIEPTHQMYPSIMNDLKNPEVIQMIRKFPWPEMQYLTQKWSGSWHTIDIRYASFSGYPRIDLINGIHYAGIKPWAINQKSFNHYSKFIDFRIWHILFGKMLEEYPNLMEYPKLTRLNDTFTKLFDEGSLTKQEEDQLPKWG